MSKPKAELTFRAVAPDDWPMIARLFGPNGACGGCWCMWPRLPKGGKLWHEAKGAKNRASFQRLVKGAKVHAVLAFAGDEPVGWCCFGPYSDFPRLETVRALQGERPPGAWSIVCFYIPARWRARGVATQLLEAATARAFELGAERIEGYPQEHKTLDPYPAAFVWMGVPELFKKAGYKKLRRPGVTRAIYVMTDQRAKFSR